MIVKSMCQYFCRDLLLHLRLELCQLKPKKNIEKQKDDNRLTVAAAKKNYQLPASLLKHLPWVEFDEKTQSVLLQDTSVGAVFELSLTPSEAKPESYLERLRDALQGIFQDTFPQYSDEESPWILQEINNDAEKHADRN